MTIFFIMPPLCVVQVVKLFAHCSHHLLDATWEDVFILPVIFYNAHLALTSMHFNFQSHCGPSSQSPLQQAGPASTLITIRGIIDKASFHQLTDGGLGEQRIKKKKNTGGVLCTHHNTVA